MAERDPPSAGLFGARLDVLELPCPAPSVLTRFSKVPMRAERPAKIGTDAGRINHTRYNRAAPRSGMSGCFLSHRREAAASVSVPLDAPSHVRPAPEHGSPAAVRGGADNRCQAVFDSQPSDLACRCTTLDPNTSAWRKVLSIHYPGLRFTNWEGPLLKRSSRRHGQHNHASRRTGPVVLPAHGDLAAPRVAKDPLFVEPVIGPRFRVRWLQSLAGWPDQSHGE